MKLNKMKKQDLVDIKKRIDDKLTHEELSVSKFIRLNRILEKIDVAIENKEEEIDDIIFNTKSKIIIDKNEERHLVYGIVYVPNEPDTDNDYSTPEEIEKACHDFMINFKKFNLQHKGNTELSDNDVSIVENYIAPCDFLMGNQLVKKGSWVTALKVFNDTIWNDIKTGKYSGFSMEGSAIGE